MAQETSKVSFTHCYLHEKGEVLIQIDMACLPQRATPRIARHNTNNGKGDCLGRLQRCALKNGCGCDDENDLQLESLNLTRLGLKPRRPSPFNPKTLKPLKASCPPAEQDPALHQRVPSEQPLTKIYSHPKLT